MASNYKKTMNLPTTDFAMRVISRKTKFKRLAEWEEDHVYEKLQEKNKDAKPFVLHDGPPYANGPIHLGHAQNKISKDIINRYKAMRGFRTPMCPAGTATVSRLSTRSRPCLVLRSSTSCPLRRSARLCRKMAVEQVDTQRQGFKRLGVLAEWENPYLTYVNDYDATDVEIFKAIFDRGAIYRGRKPVHWCSHCHTALAEAEIEYGDEVSPAIFVRFEMTTVPAGLEAWEGKLWVDIWTTTPGPCPPTTSSSCTPRPITSRSSTTARPRSWRRRSWRRTARSSAMAKSSLCAAPTASLGA